MEIPYAVDIQKDTARNDSKDCARCMYKNRMESRRCTQNRNGVRQYKERLGYSEEWMTEYVYNIVLLAKKEPKHKNEDTKA